MNKTEAAWARQLYLMQQAGKILAWQYEPLKFRLAGNTFYTPDFLVVYPDMFVVQEVKGFWRDDARVKIKVAAEMFPWFKWQAVMFKKGAWKIERIN